MPNCALWPSAADVITATAATRADADARRLAAVANSAAGVSTYASLSPSPVYFAAQQDQSTESKLQVECRPASTGTRHFTNEATFSFTLNNLSL